MRSSDFVEGIAWLLELVPSEENKGTNCPTRPTYIAITYVTKAIALTSECQVMVNSW